MQGARAEVLSSDSLLHPVLLSDDPTPFAGRMLMIGCGAVGQGSLPLIFRHIGLHPEQLSVLSADHEGRELAHAFGVAFEVLPLHRDNVIAALQARLRAGDFLVNASLDVSSLALIEWTQSRGVHYIDACLEPWAGGHTEATLPLARRTNYAYREQALALRERHPGGPSCVLAHGANPGLVSHFVKQALEDLARGAGLPLPAAPDWAGLAHRLGVKAIQVAERDGQVSSRPKQPDEFLNTWSCAGFYGEAQQPAELGWGTHEAAWPPDGRAFNFGGGASIYLDRPGLATRVRSWSPLHGAFHGWLVSHYESTSIAELLTLRNADGVVYRPTSYYAYRPSDAAVLSLLEFAERGGRPQSRERVMREEIVSGVDELGVLLMGQSGGAYWYGSQLGIDEARRLCPHNNATTLQVNAPFVAAISWALRHPQAGIVEAETMDHGFMLDFCRPYLGTLAKVRTAWTPLQQHVGWAAADDDAVDPWQFAHFRVD